jgi:PPOX class probable F420-dependent enzyme
MAVTDEQDAYLREHRLAVLATGRRDGSPQASTVMYHYDGNDIVVSAKTYTAKWNNSLRQPRVAMVVNDGRKQLVLYGTSRGVADDPDRMELSKRLYGVMGIEIPDEAAMKERLDNEKRTILRITPEQVLMND